MMITNASRMITIAPPQTSHKQNLTKTTNKPHAKHIVFQVVARINKTRATNKPHANPQQKKNIIILYITLSLVTRTCAKKRNLPRLGLLRSGGNQSA